MNCNIFEYMSSLAQLELEFYGRRPSLYRVVYLALLREGWSVQAAKAVAGRAGVMIRAGSTLTKDAAAVIKEALELGEAEALTTGYATRSRLASDQANSLKRAQASRMRRNRLT